MLVRRRENVVYENYAENTKSDQIIQEDKYISQFVELQSKCEMGNISVFSEQRLTTQSTVISCTVYNA